MQPAQVASMAGVWPELIILLLTSICLLADGVSSSRTCWTITYGRIEYSVHFWVASKLFWAVVACLSAASAACLVERQRRIFIPSSPKVPIATQISVRFFHGGV